MALVEKNSKSQNLESAFSIIETMIVLFILTIISTIMLFSFTGFNESAAMQKAAQELALEIRKAQNNAIAPSVNIIAATPAVLMHFTSSSPQNKTVTTHSDNGSYVLDGSDAQIRTLSFDRGIIVESILRDGVNPLVQADIAFASPEASLFLNGVAMNGYLLIRLRSPSGLQKNITLRASGQISIK